MVLPEFAVERNRIEGSATDGSNRIRSGTQPNRRFCGGGGFAEVKQHNGGVRRSRRGKQAAEAYDGSYDSREAGAAQPRCKY